MGSSASKEEEKQNVTGMRLNDNRPLYRLANMHGNGELIPWMRYAMNTGDFSLIDGYIEAKIKNNMYNGGKGKLESIAELVKRRNKERNERLGAFSRKKGKGKSGPNILDDFNQENNQGDLKKALKLLDGGKSGKGESKYREIVWKLEERGEMGENLVGVCLMQGGAVHNALAQRLMEAYPKLVNDVFISEDYYGLSPLHQAIVNEDPRMVAFLLKKGADVNQRCYGAFFCPDDQKGSRTDSLEHEYVELSLKTEYKGRMYFGEYPLSFAACIQQFDCYRLLRVKQGNPNLQDTNGNTVLHMVVIHEKLDMLKYAYKDGAKLQIMNKQNLTPLTLAAKLAKKTMFEEILKLESNVVWNYGDASSISYPLAKIDTINQETGQLNEDSALSLVVYGHTEEHLDLLDGLLEDLLQAKWDAFGKRNWIKSFSAFVFYYIVFFTAFMNRPFSMTTHVLSDGFILPDGNMSWAKSVRHNCTNGFTCPIRCAKHPCNLLNDNTKSECPCKRLRQRQQLLVPERLLPLVVVWGLPSNGRGSAVAVARNDSLDMRAGHRGDGRHSVGHRGVGHPQHRHHSLVASAEILPVQDSLQDLPAADYVDCADSFRLRLWRDRAAVRQHALHDLRHHDHDALPVLSSRHALRRTVHLDGLQDHRTGHVPLHAHLRDIRHGLLA
ncbi:Protein OCR-2, partial [Aphelenchoides avenae]